MTREILRRSILKALYQTFPVPVPTEDVKDHIPLSDDPTVDRQVRDTLSDLQAWDYVENVFKDNIRAPLWRILPAGRDQIQRDARELDHRIWGALAL